MTQFQRKLVKITQVKQKMGLIDILEVKIAHESINDTPLYSTSQNYPEGAKTWVKMTYYRIK